MTVLRFLGNLLLAILLIVVITLTLFVAGGFAFSQVWERYGLDYAAEGGEWLWIDGQPIYYRIWGGEEALEAEQKPWVVFVHGFHVEGLQTWSASAEELAKWGMRVIAIDLKGFGHSFRDTSPTYTLSEQATLLAVVLNQFHVKQATVVGHGWGSGVALQLAHEQPQFVGQLVLVAPRVYDDVMWPWREVADIPYVGPAAAWFMASGGPLAPGSALAPAFFKALEGARSLWEIVRQQSVARSTTEGLKLPQVDRDYWRSARQPTHIVGTVDALLAMALSPTDGDLPEIIPTTRIPTLILLGREDTCTPLEAGLRLQSELPDAKLVIIPQSGHYVHLEQSSAVNGAISKFCLNGIR